jgi:dienelactone hydrolase
MDSGAPGPQTGPMTSGKLQLACAVLAVALLASPLRASAAPTADCADAKPLTPAYATCEARNLANTGQNITAHPDLLAGITRATTTYQRDRRAALAADRERHPDPNSCTLVVLCIVDPRFDGWAERGGLVSPVLYTSRSGATMSGHVWATAAGPAHRPAIIITNGSIIGYEQGYWFLAQSLAKAGFVVMTFDTQGEGMSDQLGEAPDQREDAFAGIPVLGLVGPRPLLDVLGGNGLPFYDGTQDALDFLLSTPASPYVPRASRSTGTSHAPKQQRRVAAGLNAAYNPLWDLVDPTEVGLTGHSYGAQAASWLAQKDPRVDAAVALDSLCLPTAPAPNEFASLSAPAADFGGLPHITYGFNKTCFSTPPGPAPELTKPILGIAGDYLLAPVPFLAPPNPLGKSRASLAYSAAGVDTGQILVRGGTHLSFADLPILLPSSLRAIDLTTWYTTAWFAKYLQHSPDADAMLLTDRWQHDGETGAIDPAKDANLFSWHFDSRLDITAANGHRVLCEDLRAGCSALVPRASDGWAGDYSIVSASR